MKKNAFWSFLGSFVRNYLIFFLIVSFAVTCCMMLFLRAMAVALGIELTAENISVAAKLTFANVIIISLIFTFADYIRRKITVEIPVRRIRQASEKIMKGDFSVRIPYDPSVDSHSEFSEVIDCFNRMAEELSSIESLRSDLVANVSHELKTPLSVIKNYAKMLENPTLSENDRQTYVKAIGESSKKLSELITNILKLNKLENSTIAPISRRYDLGEQLRECVIGFEELFDKKEIELLCDIEDDIFVNSDPEMIVLIWNNLISNALKFTEKGGSISISLTSEDKYATVKVSDTGCGISREVGEHIFEKFYQGDTSRASEGNGLGLALVVRVLDLVDGEISVESELGKGSTFTVKIRRA